MAVTGYVVNPSRTKLLMRYHERREQWLPIGGDLRDNQTPQSVVKQYIFEASGLVADHVGEYAQDAPGMVFILEADELAVSRYVLEEQYNAQWLTKEQILACTCIYEPAQVFADLMLV